MGRPNALEALSLSRSDLVELYHESPDIRTLSVDLGVTVKTLKLHLGLAGLRPPWKYPPRKGYRKHHGKMDEFLRRNPEVSLPPSVPEIQVLTGLSRFTIHQYLYRRQEKFLRWVKGTWNQFLRGHQDGKTFRLGERVVPLHAVQKIHLTVDKFYLIITVRFYLRDGTKRIFNINPGYYQKAIQKEDQCHKKNRRRN